MSNKKKTGFHLHSVSQRHQMVNLGQKFRCSGNKLCFHEGSCQMKNVCEERHVEELGFTFTEAVGADF